MESEYWFRSEQFKIQAGEEDATNPGRFGKSLAEWLAIKLRTYGYDTEVIPEDWGWCVMCLRNEFLLWVACGNVVTAEMLEAVPETSLDHKSIVWHVFPVIEVPIFKLRSKVKLLFGALDINAPKAKLGQELGEIIKTNPEISLCNEP